MKPLSFAALNSHLSQYPAVRPLNEIAVWTWIAGIVLFVCVLAAALAPDRNQSPALGGKLLLPPIGEPAVPTEVVADPAL
jgi:hypothetical protein